MRSTLNKPKPIDSNNDIIKIPQGYCYVVQYWKISDFSSPEIRFFWEAAVKNFRDTNWWAIMDIGKDGTIKERTSIPNKVQWRLIEISRVNAYRAKNTWVTWIIIGYKDRTKLEEIFSQSQETQKKSRNRVEDLMAV